MPLIPIAATDPAHFSVLDQWRNRCATGRRAIRNCPILTMQARTVGEAAEKLEAAVAERRKPRFVRSEPTKRYTETTDAIAGEAQWLREREPKA